MRPFPSHRTSSELREVISQAFWQRVGRLDTGVSPYPSVRSLTFKPADLLRFLPFAWALASIAVVRYSQAQPFPLLTILGTSFLYSIGLSIPSISQFLCPASPVVIYAWTLYWFRSLPISLPLHLTVFLFPLISFSLWLFGPENSLQYFTCSTGYANLMVAMIFIVLGTMCSPPAKLGITYTGIFAGVNTGLQMANLTYFFPHLTPLGVPLCLLAMLQGGLHDPLGFAAGVVAAAASFHHLMPNALRNCQVSPIPDTSSSLESGTKKSQEQEVSPTSTVPTAVAAIDVETIQKQPSSSMTIIPLVSALPPDEMSTIRPQPLTRLPIIEQEMLETSQNGVSDSSREMNFDPTARARRRHSVGGPREPRYRPRPASVDSVANARPSRRLPTPPQTAPHRMSIASVPKSTLPPELQARWNDNLFELQERLGESSSRVAFKVREKRSGLLYVRKTFYSRQTSGDHIIRHLFDLIARQDSADASPNVVRCYGAYLTEAESDGVRGIFEFCEGGSLLSIGSVITQRGGIVGEKVAGRIASGMLQGLDFLHSVNMVHFNVRPSNVFITQSGMVKLSEPEIPGEGAVALTDRFITAVGYASPERITGNPVNPTKSDVWALGITLLEFVQNGYPYPELPTIELMIRIVQGEPPHLQDGTNATYSPKMKTFFSQCLLMDETHRPTARELLSNPWVVSVANQNVRMDKWIREVWS